MKAAVVTRFGENPRYSEAPEPIATGTSQVVVDVLASALSPRVRSQARGSHYTSTGELPLIPGIDGVGRLSDGELVYFLLPETVKGAMAERVAIDPRRSVPLPPDADPVRIAAAMNPVMASWVALRRRAVLEPGQTVLVLGATGSAGRAAVQVARRLKAGRVIAVGRGIEKMRDLADRGASQIIDLSGDEDTVARELGAAGRDVDVVLDFLWGAPTSRALHAIVPERSHDEQLLTWIQIGSVAGAESPIPSAALRAINLRIIGSGQGSVGSRAYRQEIEILAHEIHEGVFDAPARPVPLSQVEQAWGAADTEGRIVFVP